MLHFLFVTKQCIAKSKCVLNFELQKIDSPLQSYVNFSDNKAKMEENLIFPADNFHTKIHLVGTWYCRHSADVV